MRYFLGIDIPTTTKIAIDQWRDKAWAQHRNLGSVPASNFHITLAFLGQISQSQLEQLHQQLVDVEARSFELCINQFNTWQKPSIAWLGCIQMPEALRRLQTAVNQCARSAKIELLERPYVPHITLARKCKGLVTAPLYDPNYRFNVTQFALFESVSTASGVRYPVRYEWPLFS